MSSWRCRSFSVASATAAPSAVGNFQTVMVAIYISSGGCRPGRSVRGQELRIWLFCSSNSASSRTPESCSCPSSRSWASLVFVSVRGGAWGAGSAYCSGSLCASCCCDHRFPCRRETRLDTAVAVPATTAVRAIPRRRPISTLLRFVGAGHSDRCGEGSAGCGCAGPGTRVHERGADQQQAEDGDLQPEDHRQDE